MLFSHVIGALQSVLMMTMMTMTGCGKHAQKVMKDVPMDQRCFCDRCPCQQRRKKQECAIL